MPSSCPSSTRSTGRRLLALCLAAAALPAAAQQGDGTDVVVQGHTFKPAKVEATPERIRALEAPDGFAVTVFARGLENPRMLAVAPDGGVYVTRREQGDVVLLRDADGDGVADGAPREVAHRPGVHGIAIHDGAIYLATVREIFRADLRPDGTLGPLTMLVGDLPDGGQHPNRTMAFGPDGHLYVSVGSTCNACNETNPEHATLLRFSQDLKSRVIVASGLRNTLGFGWHPRTGALWGMDHGTDFLGDDQQPEELNLLEQGRHYGWPIVHGPGDENPQITPPGGTTKAQWKAASVPMALGYTAHAAPMQLAFYSNGSFPAQFEGDAFVAMRGSWNRKPASGYEIVRVRFGDDGRPTAIEPFVTGFLTDGGRTHIARPVGLAMAKDGSLLMSDDGNGVIYRVAYAGRDARTAASPATPPAEPMKTQAMHGIGVPLAKDRPESKPRGGATLQVRSAGFRDGAPMPAKYSEYADGVSPPLEWTAVPGAKSYALVMEDPDAKPLTPFVHWVAWNIPADTTALPEGLHELPRLTDPDGLMQGRTTRGSIGYFGPKPPAGDPPHRYHVQVLALDTVLDLPIGADRDRVLAAAAGHLLAVGTLTGSFRQAVEPPK